MSTAINTAMEEIIWAVTRVIGLVTLSATEQNLLRQGHNLERSLVGRRKWRQI